MQRQQPPGPAPGSPPARSNLGGVTYGAALPVALCMALRRRRAAEARVERKEARVTQTLEVLEALRGKLTGICEAAAGYCGTYDARSAFMLQAVVHLGGAGGDEDRRRRAARKEEEDGTLNEEKEEGEDSGSDVELVAFLSRARAYRLAGLTATAMYDGAKSGEGKKKTKEKSPFGSAARAVALARSVEDVSDAFVAFELLSEVLGLHPLREVEGTGHFTQVISSRGVNEEDDGVDESFAGRDARACRDTRPRPRPLPLPAATARRYVSSSVRCLGGRGVKVKAAEGGQVPSTGGAPAPSPFDSHQPRSADEKLQIVSEAARALVDGYADAAEEAARDANEWASLRPAGEVKDHEKGNLSEPAAAAAAAASASRLALIRYAVSQAASADILLSLRLLVACARRIHQHAETYGRWVMKRVDSTPAAYAAALPPPAPRPPRPCADVVDASDAHESLGFVFHTAESILRRWSVGGGAGDAGCADTLAELGVVGCLLEEASDRARRLRSVSGGPGRGVAMFATRVDRLGAMTRVAMESSWVQPAGGRL